MSQKTEATGLEYGRLLSMRPRPDGAIEVDIRNPWDTVKMLQRLLLVADSLEEFENPEGRQVVRTPLKNALV
ncbi:MAG: ABC transporter substrate-binding protein, partial [Duncaniella sp.]|nr:ABC transporter substrate-binding protein [Duncaniella sp.]